MNFTCNKHSNSDILYVNIKENFNKLMLCKYCTETLDKNINNKELIPYNDFFNNINNDIMYLYNNTLTIIDLKSIKNTLKNKLKELEESKNDIITKISGSINNLFNDIFNYLSEYKNKLLKDLIVSFDNCNINSKFISKINDCITDIDSKYNQSLDILNKELSDMSSNNKEPFKFSITNFLENTLSNSDKYNISNINNLKINQSISSIIPNCKILNSKLNDIEELKFKMNDMFDNYFSVIIEDPMVKLNNFIIKKESFNDQNSVINNLDNIPSDFKQLKQFNMKITFISYYKHYHLLGDLNDNIYIISDKKNKKYEIINFFDKAYTTYIKIFKDYNLKRNIITVSSKNILKRYTITKGKIENIYFNQFFGYKPFSYFKVNKDKLTIILYSSNNNLIIFNLLSKNIIWESNINNMNIFNNLRYFNNNNIDTFYLYNDNNCNTISLTDNYKYITNKKIEFKHKDIILLDICSKKTINNNVIMLVKLENHNNILILNNDNIILQSFIINNITSSNLSIFKLHSNNIILSENNFYDNKIILHSYNIVSDNDLIFNLYKEIDNISYFNKIFLIKINLNTNTILKVFNNQLITT